MNRREIFGMLLFGSLWGMLECILGDFLRDQNLPAGAIMTGLIALTLMTYTRITFRKRGMQLGMAAIAGILRLTNPFTGCLICSAIAIMSEGLVFEILWYKLIDLQGFSKKSAIASLGLITSYLCYVSGFTITQILTPLLSASSFYPEDLLIFAPQIFARGLPAGILGGISILAVNSLKSYDVSRLKSKLYYPATLSLTLLFWIITILIR